MRKQILLAVAILCAAAQLALGQSALPAFYSGPWKGAVLPFGWSQNGLGDDYKTNYDNLGDNAAKFDTSGDWLKIHFSQSPTVVSYFIKGNSLSGDYTFKVQESVDGSTWTDVAVYGTSNPISNGNPVEFTNALSPASRHVQFIYVTRVGGNVGLDGVRVAGSGLPGISFDPSGNQSIPVSNELVLAVSVTPDGSGVQSFGLSPAFAGSASLLEGTFRMVPFAADVNKMFTLSVVGTNSIGTSTGSVSILVQPYAPPFPEVAFSPEAPYDIMAGETLSIEVGLSPSGTGIQGWTLQPSNYVGTASLAGTHFAFASAQSDGPATYELAIVATNVHGTRTGTASIAVAAYIPPPPPGAYVIDFENDAKGTYAVTNVSLNGRIWEVAEALIGSTTSEKTFGTKALRLRHDEVLLSGLTSQTKLLTNGIGTISFWYAYYGSDGEGSPWMALQVSENLASGWVDVDSFDTALAEELTYRSVTLNVGSPVYVRFRTTSGVPGKRANLDNISISDITLPLPGSYEAFLLSYNVTPGDPGTELLDDLDGDGFSNQQEFQAGTNPYDPSIHP